MKSKRLQALLVWVVYPFLEGLRLLFFIPIVGPYAHNLIYYALFYLFPTEAESRKLKRVLGKSLTFQPSSVTSWQRRVYSADPRTVKHALKNIFARRLTVCGPIRKRWVKQGYVVPTVLLISVSTPDVGCNLACEHCYADGHDSNILDIAVFRKILDEQQNIGIFNVRLLGGEPFLYKDIWKIFAEYPLTTFQVPTNGTALNEKAVRRIAELANVYPMISMEGFRESTDKMRGEGVFDKVQSAMQNCKDIRLPFGTVVTVTRQNLEEVTSVPFLEFLDNLCCTTIGYSCYAPVGRDPHFDWQLTLEESEQLDKVSDLIFEKYSMMPVIGRNGLSRVNDCPAAKEFVHILSTGQVESCPFAHWADPTMNIANRSLLDIMSSDFMKGIREMSDLGIAGMTPCRTTQVPSLQNFYTSLGAQLTTSTKPVQIIRRLQANG